jgi:hypothetical protein
MKSLLDALDHQLLALIRVVRLLDRRAAGFHDQAPDAVAGDELGKKILSLPEL